MRHGDNITQRKDGKIDYSGGNPEKSFKSVAEEWLDMIKPQLKPSSVAKYRNILDLHLIPLLGSKNITAITRQDIQKLSIDLLTTGSVKSTGLSPKTVNCILSVLKSVFKYADREKTLKVGDITDINVKQPQNSMQILSKQEQSILSKYLCDNLTPCNLGILICLYTGLRIGEICALKWEDIYIAEHYLDVHKTMQRVQIMDDKKKTTVLIQRPKSDCSIRKIPLPDTILSILQSEKKETDAFILTGSAQKFIEPRCMENRFKTVLKACGVNNYKFHTLRHTFATRCVELGFDIKSLSEILGHASVSITLNRYVHPSMELKQKNMNLLIDLFPSD